MSSPFLLLLFTLGSPAHDTQCDESAPPADWRFEFAPADVLYPGYVADPHRPVFALMLVDVLDSDVPAAGDSRYGIRMGARFGILDIVPPGERGGGLQLDADVGFLAQFDRESSSDNIGWDGLYGFHLAWAARPDLALRVGLAHDSSHIGDEYIENTGATRIDYTRQEILAGVRYSPWRSVATYAEYGFGYYLRNEDLMEPGRVQLGLEVDPEPTWWNRRVAPFAALNVSAYEENDWDGNVTVQAGLVHPAAGGGHWRVGLEYYDGRSPIGEFFQHDERHLAFGLWIDL